MKNKIKNLLLILSCIGFVIMATSIVSSSTTNTNNSVIQFRPAQPKSTIVFDNLVGYYEFKKKIYNYAKVGYIVDKTMNTGSNDYIIVTMVKY